MEWSPNGELLLAAQFNSGHVEIFSLKDREWEGIVSEGLAGLQNAFWSPDSNFIITLSDFEIRLTIWDLLKKTVNYIEFPKFTDKCHEFSPNNRYFAVVERVGEDKIIDSIGLYCATKWVQIRRMKVPCLDLQEIKWSPDNRYICAVDTSLEYRFLIYNLQGDLLAKFEPYENSLGIKTFDWSPDAKFLSVGSYDQKVRIF
eukprot:UN28882